MTGKNFSDSNSQTNAMGIKICVDFSVKVKEIEFSRYINFPFLNVKKENFSL